MATQKENAKNQSMKNIASKKAYLLNKPMSEMSDKEWKIFVNYLGTPECKEDIRNVNFSN